MAQPPIKGRGTTLRMPGRFESRDTARVDDGWGTVEEELPPLETIVTAEPARSIISHNQSPDIGFGSSINPYKGCEHGCIYCYARPSHAYLNLSPGLDFETRIFYKPNAAELLERAAEIETSLRRHGALGGTPVRLAASLTVGSYLLPPLIGAYLGRMPQARVELQVENTEAVIAAVAAFQADAGFIEGPGEHPDLLVLPWCQDELAVIAPPGHALARKRRLTADDLAQADWVLRERGSGTREVFDRAAEGRGIAIRARLELGHTEAVLRAVSAGAGLGCLSRAVVTEAVKRGELALLRTPFLDLHRPLHAVLHRARFVGSSLRGVLAACGLELP